MKRISILELEQLLRQGNGVSECARRLGVTKGAVSKRLKALRVAITKDVALHHAGEIVEKKLDAIGQLQKINDYANELLDLLMRWNRGDEVALQVLESQVRKVKVKGDGFEHELQEFKFKDPRELALRAMAEIRGQLNLQLEIFRALYDMAAVAEFQKEVLESIKEAAPDVRDKIIFNLEKRRIIRSTLEFH
jgi:predicted TIM-barrel fold metal-dependent hydrolase